MGDKVKAQAIVDWNKEFANRTECRKKHGITEIVTNKDEIKEFHELPAEFSKTYEDRAPPVMPCYTKKEKRKMAQALSATMAACIRDNKMSRKEKLKTLRKHAEHHTRLGTCSEEFQAMIHTAIDPGKVNFMPDAKKAVDKEWQKLL